MNDVLRLTFLQKEIFSENPFYPSHRCSNDSFETASILPGTCKSSNFQVTLRPNSK
jgi:hypothetical protein